MAIADVVHDPYQQDVAKKLSEKEHGPMEIFDMSDYGQSDKVIIDIITLDSEACAPCQYMVEAVKAIVPEFKNLVEWHEHKVKEPDAIKMMSSLYVRNIPTICIDGQIKFVSIIPPKEELIAAIHDRIKEKFAIKIKYNTGKVLLLGDKNSEKFKLLDENIKVALKELGSSVEYKQINDELEIRKYGVFSTPAIVTEKYNIKSEGKVSEKNVVREWIKALNE